MILVTLFVILKSDLDVQQTVAGLLNKSLCLAPTLGATGFINVGDTILAILCWPT